MKKNHRFEEFACLKIQDCYFYGEKSPCGMPIAGQGLIFPKIDRFKKLFALLDFENEILKMTISTISMHQKNQIGPKIQKSNKFIY